MKIELEFKNKNEFSEFISGLNNSILTYQYIIQAIELDCEIPNRFQKLKNNLTIEELNERFNILINQYKQLTDIEKSFN